jgi:hypothetical protein
VGSDQAKSCCGGQPQNQPPAGSTNYDTIRAATQLSKVGGCHVHLEVTRPVPKDRPAANTHQAAAKPLDASILSPAPNIPAYVVLLTTRYGMPRRRVYLDLGAARGAVARANDKGQQASLVLCELTPVQADLDVDGEVAE